MTKVLFVCLGNICRSPMAEAIFRNKVESQGFSHDYEIDSAGTGNWHVGELPDPRTLKVLAENGITKVSRARQVRAKDFMDFDIIIAMDFANVQDLKRWDSSDPDRVSLMSSWDPKSARIEVPDPYYGDLDDFRDVYQMLESACQSLLTKNKKS